MEELVRRINQMKDLYLDRVVELNDLEVEFWITEASSTEAHSRNDGPTSSYLPIERIQERLCRTFDGYIAFAVFNESYEKLPREKTYSSRLFQIVTSSGFLDYVRGNADISYAKVVSDGSPLRHYRINCLNHIIDVASCFEPSIAVNEQQKEW